MSVVILEYRKVLHVSTEVYMMGLVPGGYATATRNVKGKERAWTITEISKFKKIYTPY